MSSTVILSLQTREVSAVKWSGITQLNLRKKREKVLLKNQIFDVQSELGSKLLDLEGEKDTEFNTELWSARTESQRFYVTTKSNKRCQGQVPATFTKLTTNLQTVLLYMQQQKKEQ